jgi:hypothetical protein
MNDSKDNTVNSTYETHSEEPKEPKKKGARGLIIFLILIIISLLGYIVYNNFITKKSLNKINTKKEVEQKEKNSSLKKDQTKNYIYYDTYDTHLTTEGKYYQDDTNKMNPEFVNESNEIVLKKLVLNINSSDANIINEKIQQLFDTSKSYMTKNYACVSSSSNNDDNTDGWLIIKTKDNTERCMVKLHYLTYDVIETDNYISIAIIRHAIRLNGDGGFNTEAYTISKKTGKLYTDEQILQGITPETVMKNVLTKDGVLNQEAYDNIMNSQITITDLDGKDSQYYKNKYFYLTSDGNIGVWYITMNGQSEKGIYVK